MQEGIQLSWRKQHRSTPALAVRGAAYLTLLTPEHWWEWPSAGAEGVVLPAVVLSRVPGNCTNGGTISKQEGIPLALSQTQLGKCKWPRHNSAVLGRLQSVNVNGKQQQHFLSWCRHLLHHHHNHHHHRRHCVRTCLWCALVHAHMCGRCDTCKQRELFCNLGVHSVWMMCTVLI